MYSKSTEGFPASGGAALIALAVAAAAGACNPEAASCGSFSAVLLYASAGGEAPKDERKEGSFVALVLGPLALYGIWCGIGCFIVSLMCAMVVLAWLRS